MAGLKYRASLIALSLGLCGCAVTTPNVVVSDDPKAVGVLVSNVLSNVRCQIRRGYFNERLSDEKVRLAQGWKIGRLAWLKGYGAYVTLALSVDEEMSIGAEVTPVADLSGSDSISLKFGATGTKTASRVETVKYFIPFSDPDFVVPKATAEPVDPTKCGQKDASTIEGYLALDRIFKNLFPMRSAIRPLRIPAVASTNVVFGFKLSGNANPVWQITRFVGGPNIAGSRQRKSDVTVSLGPLKEGEDGQTISLPSQALEDGHNEAVFRSVVDELDRR